MPLASHPVNVLETGISLMTAGSSSSPMAAGVSLAPVLFNGPAVRMGVSTGKLPDGAGALGSEVMNRAKDVSDAGSGGQVCGVGALGSEVMNWAKDVSDAGSGGQVSTLGTVGGRG